MNDIVSNTPFEEESKTFSESLGEERTVISSQMNETTIQPYNGNKFAELYKLCEEMNFINRDNTNTFVYISNHDFLIVAQRTKTTFTTENSKKSHKVFDTNTTLHLATNVVVIFIVSKNNLLDRPLTIDVNGMTFTVGSITQSIGNINDKYPGKIIDFFCTIEPAFHYGKSFVYHGSNPSYPGNGVYKKYCNWNGRVIEEGPYVNSLRHGVWKESDHETGELVRVQEFDMNVMTGTNIDFRQKPYSKRVTEYKNGHRHGLYQCYQGDTAIHESYYENSRLSGKTTMRRQNGTLEREVEWADDERHGSSISYAKNGITVVINGFYDRGHKIGLWEHRDDSGKLISYGEHAGKSRCKSENSLHCECKIGIWTQIDQFGFERWLSAIHLKNGGNESKNDVSDPKALKIEFESMTFKIESQDALREIVGELQIAEWPELPIAEKEKQENIAARSEMNPLKLSDDEFIKQEFGFFVDMGLDNGHDESVEEWMPEPNQMRRMKNYKQPPPNDKYEARTKYFSNRYYGERSIMEIDLGNGITFRRTWHCSGWRESEGFLIDEMMTGKWTTWFNNDGFQIPRVHHIKNYSNNKQNGLVQWFHENGTLFNEEMYVNGTTIGFKIRDKEGKLVMIQNYARDVRMFTIHN